MFKVATLGPEGDYGSDPPVCPLRLGTGPPRAQARPESSISLSGSRAFAKANRRLIPEGVALKGVEE